jgi:hypothetical protein
VSLGGGATNLMADIAADAFGGRFAAATFVGFASPIISTAAGILNVGFENDPVYKAIKATPTSRRAWTTLCSRQASTWPAITTVISHSTIMLTLPLLPSTL